MLKKKADMSINLIIIAIIALLVLIVVSYLFVGKMADYRKGVDKCENAGGVCKAVCAPTEKEMDKKCNKNGNDVYDEGALKDGICCIAI